jgi:transcriptional regulator with XRE-family HTH domain
VVSALRKRRIEAGYPTLEAIAKATGISYGRISQFERGYWRLGPAYLEAYARALRCSTEDVLRDQPAWDIAPLGGTSYRRKGYKRRIALPPEFIERAKKVLVDFDQSLEDWLVEIGNEKLDEIEGVE